MRRHAIAAASALLPAGAASAAIPQTAETDAAIVHADLWPTAKSPKALKR